MFKDWLRESADKGTRLPYPMVLIPHSNQLTRLIDEMEQIEGLFHFIHLTREGAFFLKFVGVICPFPRGLFGLHGLHHVEKGLDQGSIAALLQADYMGMQIEFGVRHAE